MISAWRVAVSLPVVAVLTLATACRPSEPTATESTPAGWTLEPEPVSAFPGPRTGQPQLTASARGVVLSWIDRTADAAVLKFSERTDAGWSSPRTAASGTDWFVNDADVPSVFRASDGRLVASWLQETDARREAYDLWMSASSDEGATWMKPMTPHRDATTTQHGFASMFESPGSGLGVVWLDGRGYELDRETPDAGWISLRFAEFDTTWRPTAEGPVALRVCECCQTSVAVTADGPLVAFRGRTDQEVRDILVSRLEHHQWTVPAVVHADNWELLACPVNGPAVAARGRDAVVAWFTGAGFKARTLVSFSNDAGRSWGAPIRFDDGDPLGRVDVELLSDGSAVATWVEMHDGRGQFRLKRIQSTGAVSPPIVIAAPEVARVSGYPRMAARGEELVFAWTESLPPGAGLSEARSALQTAVARVPEVSQ